MTISTNKCGCKLKLQAEVASCRLQCPLKTIIQIEDSSIPMQVKFTVKEGYNHDSIVTSLIAKRNKLQCQQKCEELKLTRNYTFYHVMQQQ